MACFCFGGTDADFTLVHVSHFCFCSCFDALSYSFGSEAWPPLEVAGIDGLTPCRCDWIARGGVVKIDELPYIFAFINAVGEKNLAF